MHKIHLNIGVLFSAACLVAAAATGADPIANGSMVLVEIDGAKMTLADLEQKSPTSLFQARNSFYQAERKAVDKFVDDYLLQRQAAKEHVTVDELLKSHVTSTFKEPPEDALRVYYEGVDTTEPYESVRGQIIDHLRERRVEKAKSAYLQALRKEARVSVRLGPPRLQVPLKDTPVRGRADASVMIVEYADYECPYCQQIQPALDQLLAAYKDKVALAYKDVPLPMHASAQKAAEAAHCAGAQGKYWEYHDVLFAGRQLEPAKLKETARTLKLDAKEFDTCLDSGAQTAIVKSQLLEGSGLGLQGTPSFFINGRFFSGTLTYEALRAIVDEELVIAESVQSSLARR